MNAIRVYAGGRGETRHRRQSRPAGSERHDKESTADGNGYFNAGHAGCHSVPDAPTTDCAATDHRRSTKRYVDLVDFPVKGSAQAKAVVVEFSDYECPFCARHATTVLPELMKRFVDGGIVRYALANNPLPMHRNADWLARMALCAGEQGRYWACRRCYKPFFVSASRSKRTSNHGQRRSIRLSSVRRDRHSVKYQRSTTFARRSTSVQAPYSSPIA